MNVKLILDDCVIDCAVQLTVSSRCWQQVKRLDIDSYQNKLDMTAVSAVRPAQ